MKLHRFTRVTTLPPRMGAFPFSRREFSWLPHEPDDVTVPHSSCRNPRVCSTPCLADCPRTTLASSASIQAIELAGYILAVAGAINAKGLIDVTRRPRENTVTMIWRIK